MNEQPRRARITAVVVRAPGQPGGDTRAGLEIETWLDSRGQIQPSPAERDHKRVRRFWPDREDWLGELVAVDGGWGVRAIGDDDEPVWELQVRLLRPGEYITLIRPTDAELVFRIVNVETL